VLKLFSTRENGQTGKQLKPEATLACATGRAINLVNQMTTQKAPLLCKYPGPGTNQGDNFNLTLVF
jgi:hypothetical protein